MLKITGIDLHSQHRDIQTQDFMQRPIPSSIALNAEGFDILSLSLVVNYVEDEIQRGYMLKQVSPFLREVPSGLKGLASSILPALFLVLPAPCVTNSRYLDEERLVGIMRSLRYKRVRRKMSAKLIYYIWKYEKEIQGDENELRRVEVRGGNFRNNFAVVIA